MPSIPEYIAVTDSTGTTVAFLAPEPDGITAEISLELNGPGSITIKIPTDSTKAQHLLPEYHILAGGRDFVVFGPATEERSRDGRKTWLQVTAPELRPPQTYPTIANDAEPSPVWGTVSILASDLSHGGFDPGSAGSALTRLLAGSGWTVGTVDVTGTYDLETFRLTLAENIARVQELWGGYLVWDSAKKTISLRSETAWQPGTGVRIEFAKNLKGVTREVDAGLVTRLYPFGQDSLTIASVNGGQLYIDDNHYSDTVYEGIYENQEITDPAQLLAKAQAVIAELSEPRVSYRVDLADLSALPEYAHEEFALGDIVRVLDPDVVRRLITIDDLSAAYTSVPGDANWDPDCDLYPDGRINSSDLVVLAQMPGSHAWVNSTRGVDLRVIRHTYNVFRPWQATVEVGKPLKTLPAMIAGAVSAANFVQRALRPNPGTGNLLRGFVNTFATQINSASGKLVWSDDALQAIEIDGDGNETGKRVRITPGGIGISTDGGVTYATAMTGQGILANYIIVSDLYALSSDDGYTKVTGNGLHVFDAATQERVHVGRWLIGEVEHYGIRIFANDGTVLLDDRGSLQTWEKPGGGNVDAAHPAKVNFYLPPETLAIKRILLRFNLEAFRSDSKAAASGGGSTSGPSSASTTSSGGGSTSGPSSASTTSSGGGSTSGPSSASTTSSGGGTTVTSLTSSLWSLYAIAIPDAVSSAGSHNHGIANGTWLLVDGGGSAQFLQSGSHTHSMTADHRHSVTIDDHTHPIPHTHSTPDHTHPIPHTHSTPDHTHPIPHTHSTPDHGHPIEYGIYEGPSSAGITVKVNGVDRTNVLGGPFNTDQVGLDIAPYVTVGATNVVELGASGLGMVDATVFIQVLLGV